MSKFTRFLFSILLLGLIAPYFANSAELRRGTVTKRVYESVPDYVNSHVVIIKFVEGTTRPTIDGARFVDSGGDWDRINEMLAEIASGSALKRHITADLTKWDAILSKSSSASEIDLPDLALYHEIRLPDDLPDTKRLELVNDLLALELIETAYFEAIIVLPQSPPSPATTWESFENYLQPAPTGIDAYFAWDYAGGKGSNVKVIDIEGNWVESHEDLRGGVGGYHIAGTKIADPTWYNHGTAVLGEIAADSNGFGMTGIAHEVVLGTISIGSMSIANALVTAVNNSDTGDIILIELQIGGPNNGEYVPVEYEQATFDAILAATTAGRIVVEAGANGGQNLDDAAWYGQLFDTTFRFSGAVLVGAANASHSPEGFSSYGSRLDAHGFGSGVYTLGYGDLSGSDTTNHYTASFSGTSSASPIIVGACAILQSIHKGLYSRVLDYNEMRRLLKAYSTPQLNPGRHIGPMPDLAGSVNEIVGVSFARDTGLGWVPFDVAFSGASGLPVTTWTWDFGDGDSSSLQSPVHTYQEPGIHDVTLQIDASGDIRSLTKSSYIIALADSLIGEDTAAPKDSAGVLVIRARNTVPLDYIIVPVDFVGQFDPIIDSLSVMGCRTDYFEQHTFVSFDLFNSRYAIRLRSSTDGSRPDLAPGEGPIVKVHFHLPGGLNAEDTVVAILTGYSAFSPEFSGPLLNYEPVTDNATIKIGGCLMRGDMDNSTTIDISDLTFMVSYMFGGGPAPDPLALADIDCTIDVDISDLTYLVAYMFGGGSAPCTCP